MEFRKALQNHIKDKITLWVGPGTDPTYSFKAIDDHVRDFDAKVENPLIVVVVRQLSPSQSRIGTRTPDHTWVVHIYYLAIANTWEAGEDMRDVIVGKITRSLEADPLLESFASITPSNTLEQVFEAEVENVTFDGSGEAGYYSFTSVLQLRVDTNSTENT